MGNEDRETSFVFNHYDPRFQDDPYPIYERLRSSEPIHKTSFNTWIVTAYAHADAILKDPRFEIDNLPERIQKKATDYQEESFLQLAELLEHWLFVCVQGVGRAPQDCMPDCSSLSAQEAVLLEADSGIGQQ